MIKTYSLYLAVKSADNCLYFISKGICDQISIALHFDILALQVERGLVKQIAEI